MDFPFTTLSLLAITFVASYIFYKKIIEAQEEYESAKDIVVGLARSFNRQLSGIRGMISDLEEDFSEARKFSIKALTLSSEALDISAEGVESGKRLEERMDETERSIGEMNERIKELAERPVIPSSAVHVDAPIPVREDAVLDQLTSTELEVLFLIDDLGEGTVPKLREEIDKTREHTARLLKKLFDRGFIDRNTSSMPYRYTLRKEIVELVQRQKADRKISL